MFDLFYMGGPLWMGILTLLLLLVFVASVVYGVPLFRKMPAGNGQSSEARSRIRRIKSIGLFSAVFGILGQLIGLFQAFAAIESLPGVSPALLAGGLKVSMITTIYGMVIYLVSLIIWFILDSRLKPNRISAGS